MHLFQNGTPLKWGEFSKITTRRDKDIGFYQGHFESANLNFSSIIRNF